MRCRTPVAFCDFSRSVSGFVEVPRSELMSIVARIGLLISFFWFIASSASAIGAVATAKLEEAKKAAAARGYLFASSHDEIVAKAKNERKLRALSGFEQSAFNQLAKVF